MGTRLRNSGDFGIARDPSRTRKYWKILVGALNSATIAEVAAANHERMKTSLERIGYAKGNLAGNLEAESIDEPFFA